MRESTLTIKLNYQEYQDTEVIMSQENKVQRRVETHIEGGQRRKRGEERAEERETRTGGIIIDAISTFSYCCFIFTYSVLLQAVISTSVEHQHA